MVCLASDHRIRTQACMEMLGVYKDLDFIITPEEVKRGKLFLFKEATVSIQGSIKVHPDCTLD
ncbi:hypothetical protein AMI01nite_50190 [Aneurinibacillus migulanus]|nr:hypothetical protein AMI01nite_50190 [Aneurinibacillus migulanus]